MSSRALRRRKPHLVRVATANAAEAIGSFCKGGRIVGLTRSQFSMIDLIDSVLVHTGPARVRLTTWAIGPEEIERLADALSGRVTSAQLLLDRSWASRKPEYTRRLIDVLGADAIRVMRVHAKVCLVDNDQWSVTLRGSLNVNLNRSWEQFDIDDDPDILGFFAEMFEHFRDAMPPGVDVSNHTVGRVFARTLCDDRGASAAPARDARNPDPAPDTPEAAAALGYTRDEMTRRHVATSGDDAFAAQAWRAEDAHRQSIRDRSAKGDPAASKTWGHILQQQRRGLVD